MATSLSPKMRHVINGLNALRSARNAQLASITMMWTLAATALVLIVMTSADAFLHFHVAFRWIAFTLCLLTALAGVGFAIRLAVRKLSLQAVAAIAEETRPDADNTIINAVQLLETETGSEEFIDAILAENKVDPGTIPAYKTYSKHLYTRLVAAIPLITLAMVSMFAFGGERFSLAFNRIIKPFADIAPFTETYITEITPGSITVRRGEPFTVTASLKGIIPDDVIVEWKIPSADTHDAAKMIPATAENSFAFDFPATFDNVQYRIVANDATSQWAEITVDNPPGLENWEIKVVPPTYTGREPYTFTAASETREIIGGSDITFAGAASKPLAEATFLCDKKALANFKDAEKTFSTFICKAKAPYAGSLAVKLLTPQGLTAELPLPIAFIPDKIPIVTLVDTPTAFKINKGDSFTVTFGALDDYGIESVTLEQLLKDNKSEEVATVKPNPNEQKLFRARFVIDTQSFNLDNPPLRFRLRAAETASNDPRRHGLSPIISVTFFTQKELDDQKSQKEKENEASLDRMLVLQRNALKTTNDLALKNSKGTPLEPAQISDMYDRQKEIREIAIAILQNRDMLGAIGDTLAGMVNKEFTEVLTAIDELNKVTSKKAINELQNVAKIQTRIIALLSTMNQKALASEEQHKGKADIFALIQRLVKDQNVLIRLCTAAQKQEDTDFDKLANYQVGISKTILAFNDKALKTAEEHAQDDFSAQLRRAVDAIDKAKSYGHSMEAVDELEGEQLPKAIAAQKLALKGLADAYTILNQWRLENAKKTIEKAKDTIADVKEALEGIEQTQARIAEVARELHKRALPEDDPTLKDDMEKMVKEHEKMLDLLEKLANDLYQFPDLPVCNELNTKMREIFEDVMQAKDSEKLKAVEIAVQKEDALLDLIRNTTERIDDVEMWLPDVPDHFVWNMESFDADEFPEMPLVELPEELQDIVGELLEQDMEIDALSQDTTGNNMIADMEMGWAVMDGPMPSFSAKGKSGNTRPNDNEMTGRSGSGREGQSTGELVENHVKGYEGRKTHARKTNDKFQKGQVTEDKDSTMDARSTGGGKLGGDSESIGMFGNTVRRDLHRGAHGTTPRQLRQETDVLFAKARLLYVNPGSLGEAAHHLSGIGKNPPDLKSFETVKRKVVRRLSDSVIEMQEGTVLPMPVDAVIKHNANTAEQRKGEAVSDEYKPQLNNYFKSLKQ